MQIRLPPKKVIAKFHIIYELEGCQKAVDFLTDYYGVRTMEIILNGRKVGNPFYACYLENKAYFTKKGLRKRTVLHELYHHLVHVIALDMSSRTEEKEAKRYAQSFLRQ